MDVDLPNVLKEIPKALVTEIKNIAGRHLKEILEQLHFRWLQRAQFYPLGSFLASPYWGKAVRYQMLYPWPWIVLELPFCGQVSGDPAAPRPHPTLSQRGSLRNLGLTGSSALRALARLTARALSHISPRGGEGRTAPLLPFPKHRQELRKGLQREREEAPAV